MRGSVIAFAMMASMAVSGCQPPAAGGRGAPGPATQEALAAPIGSLEWAERGPWRIEPERDVWRRPVETLSFFGVRNDMTVVEVFPGRGWYSAILAPYLAKGGGVLYAASFDPETATPAQLETLNAYRARFLGDRAMYGDVRMSVMAPNAAPAPAGSADLVLVFRNVHTLMAQGYAKEAFKSWRLALKPGGVLGIVQHRAAPEGIQDPLASTGYVQEAYVRALAEEAGFVFMDSSEINANPNDDRDHPFGVWTLPPVLRSAPLGAPDDPSFDLAPYRAIGESDRMTLKFQKPARQP